MHYLRNRSQSWISQNWFFIGLIHLTLSLMQLFICLFITFLIGNVLLFPLSLPLVATLTLLGLGIYKGITGYRLFRRARLLDGAREVASFRDCVLFLSMGILSSILGLTATLLTLALELPTT